MQGRDELLTQRLLHPIVLRIRVDILELHHRDALTARHERRQLRGRR